MPLALLQTYASLPERFYTRTSPTPVREPSLIKYNHALAQQLGLSLQEPEALAFFSGNSVPEGAKPVAMAYAGHQFGHFVPQLGDGRALLLGEVSDPQGKLHDIHLKGSGQTPFSRRGDGRAALGPVIREYIISEAMHALGIPTTRSLAVVTTGEPVFRETPLPGAVLTRVAASHIRIGTFEYFATRGDGEALQILADYCIKRHYPELALHPQPHIALLEAVAEVQAKLVAAWMHVGFVHGVMNTDNMTISGETIDYGPCAFMEAYDPATVFSSIDHHGRYAYGNQPHIAQWNIARLAEALLVAGGDDDTRQAMQAVVNGFHARFVEHWLVGMRRKLGFLQDEEGDLDLITDLLEVIHAAGDDYTNTLRGFSDGVQVTPAYAGWGERWQQRVGREGRATEDVHKQMKAANPTFIPRNHRVEEAIEAAVKHNDYAPMEALLHVLERPYDDQPKHANYKSPAAHTMQPYRTFCGT